jgi:hypothetical protein
MFNKVSLGDAYVAQSELIGFLPRRLDHLRVDVDRMD